MKRNALCFFTAVVLLLPLIPAIPAAAEVLTVSTLAELEAFRDSVNSGEDYHGVTVTLTADIDLGGSEENQWTPIGTRKNSFDGIFDGGDHSITGLYINQPDNNYQGLFGVSSGTFQNFTVEGYVSGATYTGGIAGRSEGSITNCSFAGSVCGDASVGGVVGYKSGSTISDCYNTGSVTGSVKVGGVAGYNYGSIIGCYNTGTVIGDIYGGLEAGYDGSIGGVVGYSRFGEIINCYNTGTVTGLYTIGGVVGYNGDTVTGCYNTGPVNGTESIGGVVGCHFGYNIIACYNTGSVDGNKMVGGVVGDNSLGNVIDCYNTGVVIGSEMVGGIAGIVGSISVIRTHITDCYYLARAVTINGVAVDTDAGNATAIDAAAFADSSVFTNWNFIFIWTIDESLGRPVLRPRNENSDAPEDDTYFISTPAELKALCEAVDIGILYRGVHVTLTADIDLGGSQENPWTPIGTYSTPFAGIFDGGGHTISGLYINRSSNGICLGLFGGNAGTIQNLRVDGIFIGKAVVSSVAATNFGTITNCYSTGNVSGNIYVGGIAGDNYGIITNCYYTGAVSGSFRTGGIAGYNAGSVADCYYSGTVTDNQSNIGAVGENNNGTVTNCYHLSNKVTINAATTDVDTNNSTAIDAAAFAEQSTYNDWDFVNIWIMNESLGRPILRAVPEDGSGIVKGWFVDVPQGAWYYEPVQYTFAQGLMTGVSGTEFAPDADVTRGMFVTVLYRMENTPETATAHGFTDVPADAYYADAVAWASENGIVTGFSAEQFAPEENITREQMAAILHRYAALKGHDTAANGALSYTDNGAISDYARDAVTWASFMGILQGNADGTFAPAANVTRAEAAAVFQRMVEKLQ